MRRSVSVLILVSAVAVVYRHAVPAYFFQDDFQWLVSTWTFEPARIFDIGSYNHFYRPVIELYFWAATPLFGGSPALFHLVNVVLHAINGFLLFLVVRELTSSERSGYLAALFFVVLPGYIEAVAWIGALAEPVGAFFGCTALYALFRSRCGSVPWRALSVTAFALALLTHESSVIFLAILALGFWATTVQHGPARFSELRRIFRLLTPYIVVTVAYLVIDIPINRRSYLVDEKLYTPGFHIVQNTLVYIVSLYVGKRDLVSYIAISVIVVLLLVRGNRRVQFATCWMMLAILPFAPFTWGNTSRYLYLPAMGFAILLAIGFEWLDTRLLHRLRPMPRMAVFTLVAVAVTIRFMVFATKGVHNFAERTEAYRRFTIELRQKHPQLPRGSVLTLTPEVEAALHQRYLQALVQWEYQDPTITVSAAAAGATISK